ncbi:hypothetical protein HanIR_Chr09g0436791 [Helianthus annuus]|nr:hypothetical protein HanIR_Chr09g0436791 [Helianthus annuus]
MSEIYTKSYNVIVLSLRSCVVVNQYNALIMGRFVTRVIPVSMGHYSIKWCSGSLFQ